MVRKELHGITRSLKLQSGYYYLLDDKKVRMSSYYANHFEAPQITSITGLHLAEDRPYVTENSE